jgi:hypothetical protein
MSIEERQRERNSIRAAMEEQFNMGRFPQRAMDLVWAMAWEQGHSSGEGEIRMWYEDLVEILLAART